MKPKSEEEIRPFNALRVRAAKLGYDLGELQDGVSYTLRKAWQADT
jgi:hypothetical protein